MKRKVSRLLALAAAAATLAGALTACGNPNADGGGDCKYAIGNMGALSGPNAGLGTVMRDGAKTAVKLYNKKHSDKKVCLVEEDSQGNEKDAPGVAKQLVKNKKVLGVVGPGFSGETMASMPIFEQGKLPVISGSATAPELAEKGWKMFHRTIGNDSVQGPADAKFISDTLKAKKVFVIDDKTAYGAGLAKTLKKALGSKVVGTEHSKTKQTEFGPIISKIKAAKPDAVFYSGYYAEGGPFTDQLRKAGVKATMIGPDGLKDENFIKGAGKAHAEGTILTCPCIPGEKAKGSFAKDFKKIIGEAPGTYGAEAYDAANVFLQGIESGITDRGAMLKFVNKYDKPGASKQIKFDDKGNIVEDVVWTYKVKDGKIVANAPVSMS